MEERMELTPHELINECYPIACACVGPLKEIVKVNPELAEEVIELAIVIGINQAMKRIDWDNKKIILEKINVDIKNRPAW